MSKGKGFLDLFEERKETTSADHQEVSRGSPVGPPLFRPADGASRERGKQHPQGAEQRTPQLLLEQLRPAKKERCAYPCPLRNLETQK